MLPQFRTRSTSPSSTSAPPIIIIYQNSKRNIPCHPFPLSTSARTVFGLVPNCLENRPATYQFLDDTYCEIFFQILSEHRQHQRPSTPAPQQHPGAQPTDRPDCWTFPSSASRRSRPVPFESRPSNSLSLTRCISQFIALSEAQSYIPKPSPFAN